MIRAIQIGRGTVQCHVTATWPDPMGEHGSIVSQGVRYTGRLVGGRGNSENRPDRLADKGEGGGRRVSNIEKFDSAPRCYECDCENGGADCNWIAPPPPACQECWGVGYFLVEESGEDVTCRACGGSGNTKDLCNARGGSLRAEFPPYRLENKGFGGGAVEVCPLCDIAGCRHIRAERDAALTELVRLGQEFDRG